MNQNLEIEFKNLLIKSEYDRIYKSEFSERNQQKITQTNHYFDTKDQDLKALNSALRIRKTNSFNELTLKSPSEGFLLETNVPLSDNKYSEILEAKQLKLSSYISDLNLTNIIKETIFYLFNAFKTVRYEKQVGKHLIVLDQTTFHNGAVDFELEVESTDAVLGREFFEQFLEKYTIPKRPALPKIARAEEN
jgi:uncharacterized protein YjbK